MLSGVRQQPALGKAAEASFPRCTGFAMQTRADFKAPLTVVTLFALLLVYATAYAALLQPTPGLQMTPDGSCQSVRRPEYRAGGNIARYAFWPAHLVDQTVRPGYWKAN